MALCPFSSKDLIIVSHFCNPGKERGASYCTDGLRFMSGAMGLGTVPAEKAHWSSFY